MCTGMTNAMFYGNGNIVQDRFGLRRIQGSVMTWRSNCAGGLERYSVCMYGCMFLGCDNNNR